MNIELGAKYEDGVTGFKGVATAICENLDGVTNVELTPRVSMDGKVVEIFWVDVNRLTLHSGEVPVGYCSLVEESPC